MPSRSMKAMMSARPCSVLRLEKNERPRAAHAFRVLIHHRQRGADPGREVDDVDREKRGA